MMLSWVRFGRLLSIGTALYERGEYLLATEATEKALEIDNEDFTAIFLFLRLAVLQNEVDCAEECITRCHKINPYAAGILVPPWQEALATFKSGEEIPSYTLKKMNQESRENLKKLQDERSFGIWSMLMSFVFLTAIAVIWTILFPFAPDKLVVNGSAIITAFFFIWYYNSQSKLQINPYMRLAKLVDNTVSLFRSFSFLVYLTIIVIAQLSVKHTKTDLVDWQDAFEIFTLIVAVPIFSQIRNCGFLFQVVKKYGTIPSYLLVGIIGALFYQGTANFLPNCIIAIIYLRTFERFNTMVAPIFLVSFHNLLQTFFRFI